MFIHVSDRKLRKIKDKYRNSFDWKPNGFYMSKGSWLFHELGIFDENFKVNKNCYIYLCKIDLSDVYTVTDKKEIREFEKEYQYKRNGMQLINWKKLSDEYSGFMMIPNIVYTKLLQKTKTYQWVTMFDVETLSLWDTSKIVDNAGIYAKKGTHINDLFYSIIKLQKAMK
jgi:hypothetical protein